MRGFTENTFVTRPQENSADDEWVAESLCLRARGLVWLQGKGWLFSICASLLANIWMIYILCCSGEQREPTVQRNNLVISPPVASKSDTVSLLSLLSLEVWLEFFLFFFVSLEITCISKFSICHWLNSFKKTALFIRHFFFWVTCMWFVSVLTYSDCCKTFWDRS